MGPVGDALGSVIFLIDSRLKALAILFVCFRIQLDPFFEVILNYAYGVK
jgi:hypothetical protein